MLEEILSRFQKALSNFLRRKEIIFTFDMRPEDEEVNSSKHISSSCPPPSLSLRLPQPHMRNPHIRQIVK
jgi:hypothetical protein